MHDRIIVTHQNPDVDAIGGVWLLKRFDSELYGRSPVLFVPAGERLPEAKIADMGVDERDVAHVDTGGGEFDHHDEAGAETSATKKIHEYILGKRPELWSDQALRRMVAFINDTDHFKSYFWPEPTNDRYVFGIEDILNGYKLGGHGNDEDLVKLGMQCLDGVYAMMKIVVEAESEVAKGTEFESRFGKAIALLCSNDVVIKLAQKMGYVLVVRKDPELGHVRIKAAPLPEIDLSEEHAAIVEVDSVGRWYLHPGKHMLLNGSRKNLGQKATPLTLEQVVELVRRKG